MPAGRRPLDRLTSSATGGAIAGSEPANRRNRRRGAVERPIEPAERDERRADGALRVDDELARSMRPPAAADASAQNTTTLAAVTISRLHASGVSRSRVASYWSWWSRVRRATNRSIVQPTSPNSRSSLLAGGSTARR